MSVHGGLQPLSFTPVTLSLPVATLPPPALPTEPKKSHLAVNSQSLPQSGLVSASLARNDKLLSSEEEEKSVRL